MILLNQIGLAVLLVTLTLCLQCAGVTALIEWLKPRQAWANLLGHASSEIDGTNRHVLANWRLWGPLESITGVLMCGYRSVFCLPSSPDCSIATHNWRGNKEQTGTLLPVPAGASNSRE
jgi:hypothetical protein